GARCRRKASGLVIPQDMELSPHHAQAPPLPPIEIQEHAIEPRIYAAPPLKAPRLPGQNQECFLRQVVGVPRIARQHQRRPMDTSKMSLGRLLNVDARHHWIVPTADHRRPLTSSPRTPATTTRAVIARTNPGIDCRAPALTSRWRGA